MKPEEILDRTETCQKLGISRQTLLSWIRKGKLKVWKRVGTGSNAALLFDRTEIEALRPKLEEAREESRDEQEDNNQRAEPSAA